MDNKSLASPHHLMVIEFHCTGEVSLVVAEEQLKPKIAASFWSSTASSSITGFSRQFTYLVLQPHPSLHEMHMWPQRLSMFPKAMDEYITIMAGHRFSAYVNTCTNPTTPLRSPAIFVWGRWLLCHARFLVQRMWFSGVQLQTLRSIWKPVGSNL